MHLEIFPCLLDFPGQLNIIFQVFPNDLLDFIGACGYIPFFIIDFINLGLFQSIVMLPDGLSILLIFLKKEILFCWLF
jgi:hypothetical protein